MAIAAARWPPNPRAAVVADAITKALDAYKSVLNSDADFRSLTLDVKFRNDGAGVRTVIVTLQGEADAPAGR
jgi:hypothetical protein